MSWRPGHRPREPGEGELRVRVQAAAVNGSDMAVAHGHLKDTMEHRFPVVIGEDFAGTVDAVGPWVTGFAPGDRVFGVVTKPYLGDGSLAEYVTVPVRIGLATPPEGELGVFSLTDIAVADEVEAGPVPRHAGVCLAGALGLDLPARGRREVGGRDVERVEDHRSTVTAGSAGFRPAMHAAATRATLTAWQPRSRWRALTPPGCTWTGRPTSWSSHASSGPTGRWTGTT